MRKRILGIILIFTMVLILTACKGGNASLEVSTGKKSIDYKLTKTKYNKDMIKISYPKVSGLKDKEKEKEINEFIKDGALSGENYYKDFEGKVDLEIDYQVKLQNEKTLSIVFTGLGVASGTAHPIDHFYTVNIDLENVKFLKLGDFIKVDDNLVDGIKNGDFKLLNSNQKEVINILERDSLIKGLSNSDSLNSIGTKNQVDYFSYLTEESLGISVGVPHGAGDHVEFEINLDELKGEIKRGDFLK